MHKGACAGSLVELEESSCTGASGIAVGADDGSTALPTFEEHLLTGHLGAVVCLAMYQDRLLFSGSTDCTIKVHLLCRIGCKSLSVKAFHAQYVLLQLYCAEPELVSHLLPSGSRYTSLMHVK